MRSYGSRRFLWIVLGICALLFVVRAPVQAAQAAMGAAHGLTAVADALMAFIGALG
ncbi:hypothetical protein GCM10010517_30840 [Streptosporangium fragile]|uniref:MFS transporter n=1 Tax=Streptosporangium fragile TaxID=46186 RepID=A0ABN3VXM3_9ACTN